MSSKYVWQYEDMDLMYDIYIKGIKENNMSIDFTKPVYTSLCFDYSGLTNNLAEVTKKAAQSAKNDRDGDDYLILQAIKRVSIPVTDATIVDLVA